MFSEDGDGTILDRDLERRLLTSKVDGDFEMAMVQFGLGPRLMAMAR